MPEYIPTTEAWLKWKSRRSRSSFIRAAKKAGVRYLAGYNIWIGYDWSFEDLIKFGFIDEQRDRHHD